MSDERDELPYEGGAQPVEEHPTGVPGPGRSLGQIIVLVLAAVALAAALMWVARLFM